MAGLHNSVGQMSVLKELTVHCKASEKKGCHLKSPVVEKPGLTEERGQELAAGVAVRLEFSANVDF